MKQFLIWILIFCLSIQNIFASDIWERYTNIITSYQTQNSEARFQSILVVFNRTIREFKRRSDLNQAQKKALDEFLVINESFKKKPTQIRDSKQTIIESETRKRLQESFSKYSKADFVERFEKKWYTFIQTNENFEYVSWDDI